ncbi:3-hydroxyacyl-CoA dehydrogenase NAD-binding protein [Ferroglobus placidus DSM 10642]|uniref:L-gulonate 3-dehydrogenase n=1 Tax=Ferroglobus placidus (strain DSM 10642 / AEDII12DO) TaxID=589924 RepID=D3S1Q8_FERPA|nr:3-hydroxyacyl-CoA dehydrogenase family protein [Ferroglobus placidus]ADC64365.1 3-hydroxyacyl-CoA dehydrogenase NAD-binding protein [Ferroglobus placidus DSM 10642]
MRNIACIGVGTIGSSWAALFAWNELQVRIYDANSEAIEKAINNIEAALEILREITGDKRSPKDLLDKIYIAKNLEDALIGVQYVQESAAESYEVKKSLFKAMDEFTESETILATSTSGLRISEIQKAARRHPERCITVHPFNPPHIIPLVEIVPGELTSEEVLRRTVEFMKRLNKKPVIVKKDIPGMIANRLTAALWREAVNLVHMGIATPEEIDTAVKYGPGLRWAITGVFLTYHLGGGKEGIKHFLESLKESFSLRWKDLAKWTEYPPGSFEKIIKGMEKYPILSKMSYDEITKWRDMKIIEILKIIR